MRYINMVITHFLWKVC